MCDGSLVFKRLDPRAQVPERAYDGDAGLDLTSIEAAVIEPMQRRVISTGLAVAIRPGMPGLCSPGRDSHSNTASRS